MEPPSASLTRAIWTMTSSSPSTTDENMNTWSSTSRKSSTQKRRWQYTAVSSKNHWELPRST